MIDIEQVRSTVAPREDLRTAAAARAERAPKILTRTLCNGIGGLDAAARFSEAC